MELLLNSKPMDKWIADDLQVLIENPESYRENEYIDYKKTFTFLEVPKEKKREKKQEFCNDICSFANADSGYLFYGISEDHGEPKELCGVHVPNRNADSFELDRRNDLSRIQPVIPEIHFKFIHLEKENYVIVIYIKKGIHAPYTCRNSDEAFPFYKRQGNQKRMMDYNEVHRVFNQSLELTKAITMFTEERIDILRYYNLQETKIQTKGLAILHIIPDDFQNNTDVSKMFLKEKTKQCSFRSIFNGFCYGSFIPFSEGLIFFNKTYDNGIQVRIYNNGITELSIEINKYITERDMPYQKAKWLRTSEIIKKFVAFAKEYIAHSDVFSRTKRFYLCAAIIDAEGIFTESDFSTDYIGYICEPYNVCMPVEIYDVLNNDIVKEALNNLATIICLTCGIKEIEKYVMSWMKD